MIGAIIGIVASVAFLIPVFMDIWGGLKRGLRILLPKQWCRCGIGEPNCRHGRFGECGSCLSELETWHHEWRLANDREYYMIYGPKISLVKAPKRKPDHDFMGYPLNAHQPGGYIYVPERLEPIGRIPLENCTCPQCQTRVEL